MQLADRSQVQFVWLQPRARNTNIRQMRNKKNYRPQNSFGRENKAKMANHQTNCRVAGQKEFHKLSRRLPDRMQSIQFLQIDPQA